MAEKSRTDSNNKSLSWFELENPYDDVIISTRVRLVRNLADYPFVVKMTDHDKDDVTKLAKSAFSNLHNFSFIDYKDLSVSGLELLKDKNIISNKKCSGIIINTEDESTYCLVNEENHIKIAAFSSGLNCEGLMEKVYNIDKVLESRLTYAVRQDFGYLTSKIKDCGSGLKITLRIFIPSIILSGKMDFINNILKENRFCLRPVYSLKDKGEFSNCIFDIYQGNAIDGSELDQLANVQSIGMQILKTERKIRQEFADNNPTIVLNFFKQYFAKANYSLLLDYEDAVSIISAVKWGLNLKLISGISGNELNSLYYRTKLGHLKYLCNNFNFTFEDDIKDSIKLQVKRLRAIVIQQAFEGIVNEQPLS